MNIVNQKVNYIIKTTIKTNENQKSEIEKIFNLKLLKIILIEENNNNKLILDL